MTSGPLPADLITLPEAARRLGIGIDTAKKLVRSGEFPGGAALRVGRQVRVSVPRLERWLHGDTSPGRPTAGPSVAQAEHAESATGGAGRVGPGHKGDHETAARPAHPKKNADSREQPLPASA
jgi:excisionase family DNA binding protein